MFGLLSKLCLTLHKDGCIHVIKPFYIIILQFFSPRELNFVFSDDIGKTYTDGIPISKNFFQDYYKRCMTSDYHIVCCDCELLIDSSKELQQHYDETKLTHHCMAMTDVTKVGPNCPKFVSVPIVQI